MQCETPVRSRLASASTTNNEPIDIEFGTGDYVRETIRPIPNLAQIRPRGASGQICEI